MSDPTCQRCTRPIADQAYICSPCAAGLAAALTQASALIGELTITVARLDRIGQGGRSSGETPLPFAWNASVARNAITNTLTTWARHVSEERGTRIGPDVAAWLATQLEWLRHRQEAPEAWDELHYACTLLRRTVDRPAERVFAGRCQCDTYLYGHANATQVTCAGCAETYDVEAARTLMLTHLDQTLMTAAEIATLAGYFGAGHDRGRVRKLINQWAHRGLVASHGEHEGMPTYRFTEVISRVAAAQLRAS